MHRTYRIVMLAAGLLALGGAAGCGIPFRSPTEGPPTPAASPAADNLGTVIVPAEMPTPSYPPTARIVTPVATTTVSVTLQTVSFDPALDVVPGPWAPDGSALVAYVVTDMGGTGMSGPTGHLWTVDAAAASPEWDSGDIEGEFEVERLLDWQPADTLVLARADAMRVHADGSVVGDVTGIDDQVSEVDVSPDGQTVFVVGPPGAGVAWLVGADGVARRVQNDAEAHFDNWSWRPDSQMLAVADSGGRYSLVDLATASTRPLAEIPIPGHGGGMPAPIWLANGWLMAGEAEAGGPVAVNIDGTEQLMTMAELLGIAAGSGEGPNGVFWNSPDSRYALYETTGPATASTTPDAAYPEPRLLRPTHTYIRDFVSGTSREIEPIDHFGAWSPTSDRFAVTLPDGDLVVYSVTQDVKQVIADRALRAASVDWSPDGRWILFRDVEEGLWLVAGDGSTVPTRVADRIGYPWTSATWSPTGERFAVALPNADAVRDVEATNAAASADATAMPPGFILAPANLVLVTIVGAGGPEQP